MKQQLGNLYGLRIGREYGFRQCKQELGWTNYRFTNFEQINRWWEIIFSAYWMVSSHCSIFRDLNPSQALSDSNLRSQESIADYTFHPQCIHSWFCSSAWQKLHNREIEFARSSARELVEFAFHQCKVFVFEHLVNLKPCKGKYSRRSNQKRAYWLKSSRLLILDFGFWIFPSLKEGACRLLIKEFGLLI